MIFFRRLSRVKKITKITAIITICSVGYGCRAPTAIPFAEIAIITFWLHVQLFARPEFKDHGSMEYFDLSNNGLLTNQNRVEVEHRRRSCANPNSRRAPIRKKLLFSPKFANFALDSGNILYNIFQSIKFFQSILQFIHRIEGALEYLDFEILNMSQPDQVLMCSW